MSIKRVSDLPSIEGSIDSEKLLKSFMEVSYLSADQGGSQTYASRKLKVQELLDGFRDIYYSKTPISGNIYVNCDLDLDPSGGTPMGTYINYSASIYENRITVETKEGLTVRGPFNAESAYTESRPWDSYGNNQLVTKESISAQLSALKAELTDLIQSSLGQDGSLPLLTFVYSDHKIKSDSWKEAGATININNYPNLYTQLSYDNGNLSINGEPLPMDIPGQHQDSYYKGFSFDSSTNELTLPSFSSCFFEARSSGSEQLGKYVAPGVPNLKGWFGQLPSSSTTLTDGKLFKRTKNLYKTGPNDGTPGNKDRRILFDASGYNKNYKDNCDTVQPRAVTMAVYYYLGKYEA